MTLARSERPRRGRHSTYVLLLIVVWTIAMAARLYPQFGTAVRIDGHLISVEDYIAERCGARLGPDAAACLVAAHRKAQVQLHREQARSVLIIAGPAVLYFLYAALAGLAAAIRRRRTRRPEGAW